MGLLNELEKQWQGLLAYKAANTPRATRPVANPSTVINDGLINPNKYNAPAANRFKDSAFGLLGVVPGVGDAASAAESADLFNRGENFAGSVAALGALPFIPAMAGIVKGGGKAADALGDAAKMTKYELAHQTAQKNAVDMLGLPPGNTAMDRAREMGAIDIYHGSPNPNIEQFDLGMVGKNSGNADRSAVWGSNNPQNAGGYALNFDSYKSNPEHLALEQESAAILPKFVDAMGDKAEFARLRGELAGVHDRHSDLYKRFLDYGLESDGSTIYPLKVIGGKDFPAIDAGGVNYGSINNSAVDAANASGAGGVVINNVKDNAGTFADAADSVAVFDPARIRSRFAAFDPARAHESDLLAGLAPYLGIGGLLGLGVYGRQDEKPQY